MVRTRFAPSPTGLLHIGNLRSAIYPYAWAKKSGGQFILRIEDTDRDRYVAEGVNEIRDILNIFGLAWDEYMVQSERKDQGVYLRAAQKLLSQGHAFYCQCPAKNAKQEGFSKVLRDPCRNQGFTSGAVKLKVPDGLDITYHDIVLDKTVSWRSDTVYDATLLKSDGFPTYHLAAMTDDLDLQVTHILRGHDWMPSTPIHLLVFDYLGGTRPEIGHLTDILSPQGGKLSKRRDSVFVRSYLQAGYLPEAILNFVILLGWAPKDNRQLFTLDEFVAAFDPAGFQKSNPLFLIDKLDWFNGYYLRQKTDIQLLQLIKPFVKSTADDRLIAQILPLVKDRLVKLSDFDSLTGFFFQPPSVTRDLWTDSGASILHLQFAHETLTACSWTKSDIESALIPHIKTRGWKVGDFFMSLRLAVCGSRFTPPLTETMLVLGQSEVLTRIHTALTVLNSP